MQASCKLSSSYRCRARLVLGLRDSLTGSWQPHARHSPLAAIKLLSSPPYSMEMTSPRKHVLTQAAAPGRQNRVFGTPRRSGFGILHEETNGLPSSKNGGVVLCHINRRVYWMRFSPRSAVGERDHRVLPQLREVMMGLSGISMLFLLLMTGQVRYMFCSGLSCLGLWHCPRT